MTDLNNLLVLIQRIEVLEREMQKHPRKGSFVFRVGDDVVELACVCRIALVEIVRALQELSAGKGA